MTLPPPLTFLLAHFVHETSDPSGFTSVDEDASHRLGFHLERCSIEREMTDFLGRASWFLFV